MEKKSLWNKSFLGIWIGNLFLFMTYYYLMTTLPTFILRELNGSETQVGLSMTCFLLGSVLVRPLTGRMVDRFQRKKVIFISLTFFFIASMGYIIVENVAFLLILRFIHGISFALCNTVLSATATDIIPEERSGEGIAYFTASTSIAMIISPFVGLTIVDKNNYNLLFFLCAIFGAVVFLSGCFTPIHIRKLDAQKKSKDKKQFNLNNYFEPCVIIISLVGILISFAYAGFNTFYSIFGREIGAASVVNYFFVVYSITLILSKPIMGKLFDKLGPNTVIYPSISFLVIGVLVLSQANGPVSFLVAAGILGIGNGTLYSTLQTMAMISVPARRRGIATSTFFMFYDLGVGLGAYFLAIIASSNGYRNMYLISAVVPVFSALLYHFIYNRRCQNKD